MSKYILVSPETIKLAITQSESGDTIVLDDSEYRLDEMMIIPNGIKLTSVYGIRRGRKEEK
jgi:hypothetical protein